MVHCVYDLLLVVNTNLPPILHRSSYGQIFASERVVPHFIALARGDPLPISP